MTIIAELSWDQIFDGNFPQTDNPARNAFRKAVEEFAEKAREVLPESNGRIDSAVTEFFQLVWSTKIGSRVPRRR